MPKPNAETCERAKMGIVGKEYDLAANLNICKIMIWHSWYWKIMSINLGIRFGNKQIWIWGHISCWII